MAEFCVTKEPVEGEGHRLHLIQCEQLPEAEKLRYLGSYASRDAAYSLAKGSYYQVDDCPVCLSS